MAAGEKVPKGADGGVAGWCREPAEEEEAGGGRKGGCGLSCLSNAAAAVQARQRLGLLPTA